MVKIIKEWKNRKNGRRVKEAETSRRCQIKRNSYEAL